MPTIDDEPEVTIPDDAWQALPSSVDDGQSFLIATLWVNGTPLHIEAHAVRNEGEGGLTMQVDGGEDSDFEKLHAAFDGQGPMQTTTIRGREYVIFAHPYEE